MEVAERRHAETRVEATVTPPRLILAPLADFTDSPFRMMALAGGADAAVTEMVSAAALAHSHNPTRTLLEKLPSEPPPACQIFGAKEDEIAFAAREIDRLSPRFSELNLNAGCPMSKVTRSGAGAQLVKSPEKVFRLLKAMRENTSLPVTLKTRLGPDPSSVSIFELVDAAVAAGAAVVTIHARFTSQMHGGLACLDVLADAVRRSPIPVVGNGGVVDAKSALEMAATGVAGLMVGRAALARPGVFAAIRASLSGGRDYGVAHDPVSLFRRHLDFLVRYHAHLRKALPDVRIPSLDSFVALKVRTHLFRYFSGMPGAAALRASFNSVRSVAEVLAVLERAEATLGRCAHLV